MTCTRFCSFFIFVVLLVDRNVHSFQLFGLYTMLLSTVPAHCGILLLQNAYLFVRLQLYGGFKDKNSTVIISHC